MNKLFEREALTGSLSAELKDFCCKTFVQGFTAFCVALVSGKIVDSHVVGGVARELKTACNWFGSIFVVTKMFGRVYTVI